MPSFQQGDTSFFAEGAGGPVRVENPTTGSTLTMRARDRSLYVANSGTLAALTVLLPAVLPGEKFELGCQSAITALTVHDALGNAITGAPTAGAAGAAVIMRYVNKTVGWVHWK